MIIGHDLRGCFAFSFSFELERQKKKKGRRKRKRGRRKRITGVLMNAFIYQIFIGTYRVLIYQYYDKG